MSGFAESRIAVPALGTSEVCVTRRNAASKTLSYSLMLLFIFFLYSQLSRLAPALDVVRPVYTVGGAAILALVIERASSRRGLDFVSPESYFLAAFVVAAGFSCIGALWPGYAAENTLELIKMVALYFLIVNCIDSEWQLRGLVWLMVLGGLFPAVGTLRNYLEGNLQEGRARWIGILSNPK